MEGKRGGKKEGNEMSKTHREALWETQVLQSSPSLRDCLRLCAVKWAAQCPARSSVNVQDVSEELNATGTIWHPGHKKDTS